MFCLNLENFLFLYLSLWTVANGSDSSKMECSKPQCFIYNKRNASIEVKVRYSELKKSTVTTFCFGGLLKSVLHLWINPVLHIAKSEASLNETSKFITYYGTSVSDVHEKSKRQGYVVMQVMKMCLFVVVINKDDIDNLP
ncbi:uncharacterized protein LOC132747615 [Ruditapes philippinarum]|uniref:uncharacterized protein LOC132747615 n=1 Tax=Ruditapes philippinarum TaxID=129788 RepID=UPI00295B8438|nr:uncharacterized protein LOC132747615 [Ruditapes philippinarum]